MKNNVLEVTMDDKFLNRMGPNLIRMLLGMSLILFGVLFLIGRYISSWFKFDFGHYTWPFLIIIPGILLFVASFAFESRKGMKLAAIGAGVSVSGIILLIQNTFDLYASWAYAWTLVFPTSFGITKWIYGSLRGLTDQTKSGLALTWTGLAIFVFGGFFFEQVIGISDLRYGSARIIWPGLLIVLGIILLLSSLIPRRYFLSGSLGDKSTDDQE
jgi:uncharacterized membrane protein